MQQVLGFILLYFTVIQLIYIAYKDAATRRISDRSVLVFLVCGILKSVIVEHHSSGFCVLGFLAVSLPMLFLCLWKPGAFGGGDVKLMAAGGVIFGANGIWRAFSVGILLSGIYVFCLLLCKKVNTGTKIPMGPFLCAGMLFSLFLFF